MQMMHHLPLSGKELNYISDSLSNEDLLIKQCVAVAASSSNPTVQQICSTMLKAHQAHYQTLAQSLQHHQSLAPTQLQ
ncbi:hypothetical protein BVG16_16595 [Paenibacillus selenitireducens]|jgi:hypothetical protein|uniref:Spore coat protein n=1 Tax=Paenibacillus selenitireducens TaxID=1324314 RepID=A0A1T2XAC4_9BACL|nr:hypothetical protein [Paenibacillus selenitireducens]OPA76785.1 hypothetical protein BVG16_16595 [Paenibacillus selenitireducens]